MQIHDWADRITVVGLPIAIAGIVVAVAAALSAGREGKNSRDLAASLEISLAFVGQPYIDWRNLIRAADTVRTGHKVDVDVDAMADGFKSFARWLNAVGLMIESGTMARPKKVLASMEYTIEQMLDVTRPMVAAWEKGEGLQHWRGVHVLESTLAELEEGSVSSPCLASLPAFDHVPCLHEPDQRFCFVNPGFPSASFFGVILHFGSTSR